MYVFNLKVNSKKLFKIFFVIISVFVVLIFFYSSYRIFNSVTDNQESFTIDDNIPSKEYPEINSQNYTDILKEVHDNLDEYIGDKICFVGYVYRVQGLKDNQFILARNMLVNNQSESVVVGFLSEFEDAKKIENDSWIKVYATIQKGNFNGEIPILKIDYIESASVPDDPFVSVPNNTYVPTSVIY